VFLERPLPGLGGPSIEGRNHIAILRDLDTTEFFHIPSAMGQKILKRWSIPTFPFQAVSSTAYPPENLLFVAESDVE